MVITMKYELKDCYPALIYVVLMVISIIAYRKWYKHYKNIPDKTTVGRLIKTQSKFGEEGIYDDGRATYLVGTYEFEIGGKRYKDRFSNEKGLSDEIILYYKKGRKDVRAKKKFTLAPIKVFFAFVYFAFGVLLLTILLSKMVNQFI